MITIDMDHSLALLCQNGHWKGRWHGRFRFCRSDEISTDHHLQVKERVRSTPWISPRRTTRVMIARCCSTFTGGLAVISVDEMAAIDTCLASVVSSCWISGSASVDGIEGALPFVAHARSFFSSGVSVVSDGASIVGFEKNNFAVGIVRAFL